MNNIATAAPATATAAQGSGEPEATQVVAIVAVVAVVELDEDFAFDFCIAKRGFFDVGVGSCIVQTTADSQDFSPHKPEKH